MYDVPLNGKSMINTSSYRSCCDGAVNCDAHAPTAK